MTDHGPHSHSCATATDAECFCECHGAMHGVVHLRGVKAHTNAAITPVKGKGGHVDHYQVMMPNGKSPGGRDITPPAGKGRTGRMAEVDVKIRRQPTEHDLPEHIVARAAEVRAGLPKTREEWARTVKTGKSMRQRFRDQLATRRQDVETFRGHLKAREDDIRANNPGKSEEEMQRILAHSWSYTSKADEVDHLRKSVKALEDKLPEVSDEPLMDYPKDRYGRVLAPAEWDQHLSRVLDVGKQIHEHHRARVAADPRVKELEAAATDAHRAFLNAQNAHSRTFKEPGTTPEGFARTGKVRDDAAKTWELARRAVKHHEQSILMDVLSSVRSFGHEQHHDLHLIRDQAAIKGKRGLPARDDSIDRIREAEKMFPDEWVARSAQKPMHLVTADRAYHQPIDGGAGSELAIPTVASDNHAYEGGFRDYTTDTTVHEMGHRMEQTIEGLTHLEFTLVRRRSTKRKQLEKTYKLKNLEGGNYDDHEVAYKDEWADAYAGKTYESRSPSDPGSQSWEVFQVGLQDTLGRASRFDKSDQLKHFVLGALATLP